MEHFWLLYFITRLGELKTIFGILSAVSVIAALMICIFTLVDGKVIKYGKTVLITAAVSTLIAISIPTKNDLMFIAAGVGITEAAKSETVKSIANKSVQVIENYLDEQLKGNK